MTFVFLGMFIAASAGEILFNKEESDILLHRPVTPGALLWAKVRVMVEVSLWLAGAINLVGFFAGAFGGPGSLLFPLVHAFSTMVEALFCASCVVLVYQLCLRWFGRERLDGLMTLAQVIVAVSAVASGQMLPQIMTWGNRSGLSFSPDTWWLGLLPPVWFAGLDDALAGSRAGFSWLIGGLGLGATALTCWLAFVKLARTYETGLQNLQETAGAVRESRGRRRWLTRLTALPPLCWWLREPVARASFLLAAAYLVRDRDVKLRIYPGLAPMLVLPIFMMIRDNHGRGAEDGFVFVFASAFIGLVPLLGVSLLQYSQQWQAADLFRVTPSRGPADLCHGARRAVLLVLTLPVMVLFFGAAWWLRPASLPLLLPGLIAIPVLSLLPCVLGHGVPLSQPPEEAKSAGRGLTMIGVMFACMALSGLAILAWKTGWFTVMLIGETAVMAAVYFTLKARLRRQVWAPIE
jgi:hypothetical protein